MEDEAEEDDDDMAMSDDGSSDDGSVGEYEMIQINIFKKKMQSEIKMKKTN